MRRPIILIVAILLAGALFAAGGTRAQDEVGYELYRVATGPGELSGEGLEPAVLEAGPDGGHAEVRLPGSFGCSMSATFDWGFSRDIRRLAPGDEFDVISQVSEGGDCDRNPDMTPVATGILAQSIRTTLSDEERRLFSDDFLTTDSSEAQASVHASDGSGSTRFRVTATNVDEGGRFYISLSAHTGRRDINISWQIAYLYRGTAEPATGDPDTVLDSPPEDDGASGDEGREPDDPDGVGPADDAGTGESGDSGNGEVSDSGTGDAPGGGNGVDPAGADERMLVAGRETVAPGAVVTVLVRLLNPDGVANINYELTYDPSVVGRPQITRGALLGSAYLMESNNSEPGRVGIGFAGSDGLSADGPVAALRFTAIGQPGDRTPLTLSVSDIDGPTGAALPIQLIHGEIVISGAVDGGGPDPGGEPVSGDCDGDGQLTVSDASCVLQMSVDLRPEDPALDLNGDGAVTSGDARIILQRVT